MIGTARLRVTPGRVFINLQPITQMPGSRLHACCFEGHSHGQAIRSLLLLFGDSRLRMRWKAAMPAAPLRPLRPRLSRVLSRPPC